jgi:hypothetical protein
MLAAPNAESESRFEVVSTAPDDSLTERFRPESLVTSRNSWNNSSQRFEKCGQAWTGADAAYSIPIGRDKTLWLFGDTFLRPQDRPAKTKGTKSLSMINNSMALQNLRKDQMLDSNKARINMVFAPAPLEFYWQVTQNKAQSFFEDKTLKELGHWLWPLDGIYKDGKLYEFFNEIGKSQNASPAFGFAASNQLLLRVENVESPADKWKMTFAKIEAPELQVGNAVTQDEDFAYVYCSYHPAREGMNQHPQIIIRLPLDGLDKINARDLLQTAEIWGRDSRDKIRIENRWIKSSVAQPEILMQDGAPEFSVSQVKGLDGYFAVYFPSGFGTKIMLRHAPRPEGPWSEPQCLYDCPLDTERFFVYSAKSHPEFCTKDGELCVTYCENIKSSNSTALEPEEFYFPHAIKVQIKKSLHSSN